MSKDQTNPVKMVDCGQSAKSLSEVSIRQCGDQVTEGRFEPPQFDATNQTSRELIDVYCKKEQHSVDINTEPISIVDPNLTQRNF
jgi:hypothetical protein